MGFETWPIAAKMLAVGIGLPTSLTLLKCTSTVLLQDKLIYAGYWPPGSRRNVADPLHTHRLEYTPVRLHSSDGKRLHGWHLHSIPDNTSDILTRPTLPWTMVYFQGNAGNLGHRLSLFQHVLQNVPGMSIVAVHTRGYGPSRGWPCERGIQRDIEAILNYTHNTKMDIRGRIVVYGQSLGGAYAIDAAQRFPGEVDAVVVENTFTSMSDVVRELYPRFSPVHHLTPFLWNTWPSIERIGDVKSPVLLMYGSDDEVMPGWMSQRLFDAAVNAKFKRIVEIQGGMHDDTWRRPGYMKALRQFLQEAIPTNMTI